MLKQGKSGQMTVEYALAFPVMLLCSAVLLYAFLYMVTAAFIDGSVHDAIRIAISEALPIEDTRTSIKKRVVDDLQEYQLCDASFAEVSVEVTQKMTGHWQIDVHVEMKPACFHMPIAHVNGYEVPGLVHTVHMVVSPYRNAVVM